VYGKEPAGAVEVGKLSVAFSGRRRSPFTKSGPGIAAYSAFLISSVGGGNSSFKIKIHSPDSVILVRA